MTDLKAKKSKHMSLDERLEIQDCLNHGMSFKAIGRRIGKDETTIGESERAKFWLAVLNELKNRGLKDIFVLCADGLSGIKEAISAAYPQTEYQALHCSCRAQYAQVCGRQGQESLCHRP